MTQAWRSLSESLKKKNMTLSQTILNQTHSRTTKGIWNVRAISRNKPRKLTCAWNSPQNGQADDKMYDKDVVFYKLLWAEYKYVNSRSLSLHKVTCLCSICRSNGIWQEGEEDKAKPVAYPGILLGGGGQKIQLRTEDRDLGAVAP